MGREDKIINLFHKLDVAKGEKIDSYVSIHLVELRDQVVMRLAIPYDGE